MRSGGATRDAAPEPMVAGWHSERDAEKAMRGRCVAKSRTARYLRLGQIPSAGLRGSWPPVNFQATRPKHENQGRRPTALRLGRVIATYGSRVRRSLPCMLLIDADSAQGAGKNITENITGASRSNEPNPLNIGSPTRARTWDLRINRLSQSFGFSDTYVKIRSAITANLRSVKALLPWIRSDLRNRIQWRLDNRNDHAHGLWRFPIARRVRG